MIIELDSLVYLSANAPEEIPDWFTEELHGIKSPKKPVCGGITIEDEKKFVVELVEWAANIKNYNKDIYFRWRYYYAKEMIRTINYHESFNQSGI